ncbi:MAG: hypothetical protein HY287_07115 [Planctomycetes bacterium]|nr:hypothetical protein [Planctomycetota bacterium]
MRSGRHTDYRITDNSYTDMRLIDTFGAVRALPDYEPEAVQAVALRNGTDNMPVESKARGEMQDQIRDQKTRPTPHFTALPCSEADNREN